MSFSTTSTFDDCLQTLEYLKLKAKYLNLTRILISYVQECAAHCESNKFDLWLNLFSHFLKEKQYGPAFEVVDICLNDPNIQEIFLVELAENLARQVSEPEGQFDYRRYISKVFLRAPTIKIARIISTFGDSAVTTVDINSTDDAMLLQRAKSFAELHIQDPSNYGGRELDNSKCLTENEKTIEHAVQTSIRMILSALKDTAPHSIIGIYPDTPELFKEIIAAELLRDNRGFHKIIPLRGTVSQILPATLEELEYIMPIATSRSNQDLGLVVGPRDCVVHIKNDLKHEIKISSECHALIWDRTFDIHQDHITFLSLDAICVGSSSSSTNYPNSVVSSISPILGNGDYVTLYNDLLVERTLTKQTFLINLIRKANITTIIAVEAQSDWIAEYLVKDASIKVLEVDADYKAYSVSHAESSRFLTQINPTDTTSLNSLRKHCIPGRVLLLTGCIDPIKFNFFKKILQQNDLLVVNDATSRTSTISTEEILIPHASDFTADELPNLSDVKQITGHTHFLKRYHLAIYYKLSGAKISLLLPTRGRPGNILRLYRSAIDTADNPSNIEFIIALDDDDTSYDELIRIGLPNTTFFKIPRTVLSVYWNMCFERAAGDILHHCGDDLIFKTEGWDSVVLSNFEKVPDKILFAFGNDGHWGDSFGTHGFIHRKWAETVGYFVPPYFSSDYNDTWLNDVAKEIGRHRYIDIFTEHMHPAFHKADWDDNHRERLIRHQKDKVDELYRAKHDERLKDAEKLRKVMQ